MEGEYNILFIYTTPEEYIMVSCSCIIIDMLLTRYKRLENLQRHYRLMVEKNQKRRPFKASSTVCTFLLVPSIIIMILVLLCIYGSNKTEKL